MRVSPAGILLFVAVCTVGCAKTLQRRVTPPEEVATLDRRAPFLKAHLRDGHVYVLSPWRHETDSARIVGHGVRLGVNRDTLARGDFAVPLDSVVLFETNVVHTSASVVVLSVLSGISAGVTVFCIANPKACFGSCPTFYVSDGAGDALQAEGFSASIAPSLEATDVDHLFRAPGDRTPVRVRMENEALETHVVRFVRLLAAPRAPGTRVFAAADSRFWRATEIAAPLVCRAPEGDCLSLVAQFDGRERTSLADSTDLAAREVLELAFPAPRGRPALVLSSRQSLLPTFLLYQAFAWLGTSVGDWLARLERGDRAVSDRVRDVTQVLGGIEVLVPAPDGGWVAVDTVIETGPLAADTRVIPLPAHTDRVRLRLVKGAWRLEWAALATLTDTVTPVRVLPAAVLRDGREDPDALARLRDTAAVLVTLPGDAYTLVFDLPPAAAGHELFLESRGYYLEWMRSEWIAEENPLRAAQLLLHPAAALRDLAPAFKQAEPDIEQAFWNSRYVRP